MDRGGKVPGRIRAEEVSAAGGFGPLSASILRLGRAHRALASQLMGEIGLRPEQAALMMHIWAVGPVRQSALSTHFGRDSAATTRTVQRLEHAGYLRRSTDPTDRRATLVRSTTAGNALRTRVEELWQQLETVLHDALTDDQHTFAEEVLDRLSDAITSALTLESSRSLTDI